MNVSNGDGTLCIVGTKRVNLPALKNVNIKRGRVQKKNKIWYVVLELRDQDGNRRQKWLSPRKELNLLSVTKPQAEAFLVDKLKEMQEGTYFEPSSATVDDFMLLWLKNYCAPNLRKSTYALNASMVRKHIVPSTRSTYSPQTTPCCP